jgi:hypothetical protein
MMNVRPGLPELVLGNDLKRSRQAQRFKEGSRFNSYLPKIGE